MRTAAAYGVLPSAATWVTATSHASTPWANGSYAEVSASAPSGTSIAGIQPASSGSFGGGIEIGIAAGASGSETELASFRMGMQSGGTGFISYTIPVPISGIGGARVAARTRSDNNSYSMLVKVLTLATTDASITTTTALASVPNAAGSVAYNLSSTAWANASWTQLTSGLGSPISLFGIGHRNDNLDEEGEFDIGTGASGSETVLTVMRVRFAGAPKHQWVLLPGLYEVAASTRIALRVRKAGTGTTGTHDAALLYYGNLVGTDNNHYDDDAAPGSPATLAYNSNGDALYVLLSWRAPVDGAIDDIDAVASVEFNGDALTRGGHTAVKGQTIEWWRLPAHASATADVVVTMNQPRSLTFGVVNRSGWPTNLNDHHFRAAGNLASLEQPNVTVPCGTGAESMSWLGFDRTGQDVTIGSSQAEEWNQEGEDDADGNQRSAGGIKTGLTSPSQLLEWTVATLDEYWGLGALSFGGAPPQKATQLVQLYEYDEYADADAPDPPSACDGGGTNPSGTNPSAGTSLSGAVGMEFWLEVDVGGADPETLLMAKGPIPDDDGYKAPRVVRFGEVRNHLGDETGLPSASSMDSVLADTDRLFRAYMDQLWSGASTSDALLDSRVRLYGRAAPGATPQVFWEGRIRDYKPTETTTQHPTGSSTGLTFDLTSEDALSLLSTSRHHDEKLIPQWLTNDVADGTPLDKMEGKPVPLPYGSLIADTGAAPAWYTQETSAFWPAYLPRSVHFHLCGLGEIANIKRVWGAAGDNPEPNAIAPIPDSWWGTKAWAPHMPNWPFADPWIEIGGRRYTAIILEQTTNVARLAREGRIPLRWDGCGYKGSNGQMLDAIEDIILHFLINFGYGNYAGVGGFASSVPSLGSYSAIDTTTFSASKTATVNMRGSTIKGGGIIAWDLKQRPLNQIFAQLCHSAGVDPGTNQYGQTIISRLDRTVAASGEARTDFRHHFKGSFRLVPNTGRRFNIAPYMHTRNLVPALAGATPAEGAVGHRPPYDGEFVSGELSVNDGSGGTKRSDVQRYEFLRDDDDAEFVAQQFLDRYGKPRITAEWLERPNQSIDVGKVVPVTNYKGSGASGWSNRAVRCTTRILRPDPPISMQVIAEDVNDLLEQPVNSLVIDGNPVVIDGNPIVVS